MVLKLRHFEDFEEKEHLINDKGVCKTAPATPGLLNIKKDIDTRKIQIHGFSNIKN